MSESLNRHPPWIKLLCCSASTRVIANPVAIANWQLNITLFSNRNCCCLQQHTMVQSRIWVLSTNATDRLKKRSCFMSSQILHTRIITEYTMLTNFTSRITHHGQMNNSSINSNYKCPLTPGHVSYKLMLHYDTTTHNITTPSLPRRR